MKRGPSLEVAVFVAVALVAAATAPAHAGWGGDADGLAAAATWTPVSGRGPAGILVGGLAALVPIGELAYRVALVAGLAVALTAAGVVALVRALTPQAAGAGALAASLVAIAPAADHALPTAGPALTAALALWVLVALVRARRAARDGAPTVPLVAAAAVGCGALVALSPVAALVLAATLVLTSAAVPSPRLAVLAGLGVAGALVWLVPLALHGGASALTDLTAGDLRDLSAIGHPAGLGAAVRALGDGAGAILFLAGLVGLGLGAATGLPGAGACVAAAGALVVGAAVGGDGAALPALAVLAAGLGPLATAVSRLGPAEARPTIALIATAPIAVIAALAPRSTSAERTAAGAAVAADVMGAAPAGPGVFLAVEPAVHDAARLEQVVGGLRPDLALARRDRLTTRRTLAAVDAARPELHTPRIDDIGVGGDDERLAVANLRAHLTVASDRAGFGQLDPRRARPAGRGFALSLEPDPGEAAPPPPSYPGATGARLAAYLAVERGRHEAALGRLEAAARAAGLAERFGAADLAILDGAVLTPARPPLIGFLPASTDALPPPWLPDLFGDELAWLAGLPPPPLDERSPVTRRLHAAWRAILSDQLAADDPAVRALGRAAARATARALADLGHGAAAEKAARAALTLGEDAPTLLVLGSVLAERGGLGSEAPPDEAQRAALDEAETVLARAVAADRRPVDALIIRGLVLHRLGKVDLARAAWQAADALAPGRPELARLLGRQP